MLIPRGKALHENLATSYVLVDGLIADLCDGGFSGVVELVLRATDSYIIIDRGRAALAVEKRGLDDYSPTTVAELAGRARQERGRVSIYGFSAITISALVGYFTSEPLYTDLSTEFADLERMISKLSRERDREWVIKINMADGNTVLVQIQGEHCRIVHLAEDAPESNTGGLDASSNPALENLLEECHQVGGRFDVYFKLPGDKGAEEREDLGFRFAQPERRPEDSERRVRSETEPSAIFGDESGQSVSAKEAEPYRLMELREELAEGAQERDSLRESWASILPESTLKSPGPGPDERELSVSGQRQPASDKEMAEEALIMAEIKRLMGEIARTIEDATRAVEMKDIFSIHLRAGQLEVADRYPFLDPFGVEFEYLAGEIVFVGKAHPPDFIAGLTEAMRLAVVGVIRAGSHPARLRSIIIEDLQKLADYYREELERYGLDESIERIIPG